MSSKTVIVICGPTAVGKTGTAIQLAQLLQTKIISADSRQCFRELNIGVAKPTEHELAAIPHFFINSHSVQEEVNAVVFEKYALATADTLFQHHSTAVMVGGTGLYIKAFCEGLDNIPAIDYTIRQQITDNYHQQGLAYLQTELKAKNPLFWEKGEQQNPQRLMRALEVLISTGQSITTFRRGEKAERPFNIIKIGLELPREKLYKQINDRVDAMIENGLVAEVQNLHSYKSLNALQTVGYAEIFEYLEGKKTLFQAIDDIKKNTRHYAKRQMTWFKKDMAIRWFSPHLNPEELVKYVEIL